jgi:hypothetical protein
MWRYAVVAACVLALYAWKRARRAKAVAPGVCRVTIPSDGDPVDNLVRVLACADLLASVAADSLVSEHPELAPQFEQIKCVLECETWQAVAEMSACIRSGLVNFGGQS